MLLHNRNTPLKCAPSPLIRPLLPVLPPSRHHRPAKISFRNAINAFSSSHSANSPTRRIISFGDSFFTVLLLLLPSTILPTVPYRPDSKRYACLPALLTNDISFEYPFQTVKLQTPNHSPEFELCCLFSLNASTRTLNVSIKGIPSALQISRASSSTEPSSILEYGMIVSGVK